MIKRTKQIIKNIFKSKKKSNKNHSYNVTNDCEVDIYGNYGKVININEKRTEKKSKCFHCNNSLEDSLASAKHKDGSNYIVCKDCGAVSKVLNGEVMPADQSEAPLAYQLFKAKGRDFRAYTKNQHGSFEKLNIDYK